MSEAPKFCQVCRGPWPDGHEPWCPVLTGEPQMGRVAQEQMAQSGMSQFGSPGISYSLRASVERLCDALRELRRDEPECFFDTPYERLLRSMEAALESFYRSKKDGSH